MVTTASGVLTALVFMSLGFTLFDPLRTPIACTGCNKKSNGYPEQRVLRTSLTEALPLEGGKESGGEADGLLRMTVS